MIIALIALVLSFFTPTNSAQPVVIIPAMPSYAPTNAMVISEEEEWELYNQEAYYDYAAEFTAIYDSLSYKVSKNGRSMINGKFVKMGSK